MNGLGSGERPLRGFLVVALVLVGWLVSSQTSRADVMIGMADSGNCYPFMCNDSGTSVGPSIEYQQVYAANQFSRAVAIDEISFFQNFALQLSSNTQVLNGNYNIYLSTAAAGVGPGTLGTNAAANEGADNSLFFSGNVGQFLTGGLLNINGAAFDYNPANGNLLMDVQVANQDNVPNGLGNGYLDADSTGQFTSRAWCLDGTCPTLSPDPNGLVTDFHTSVPEPTSLTLLGAALFGIGFKARKAVAR